LKAFIAIELAALVMSLAIVLLPQRGSGELIDIPPDFGSYLRGALIAFGLLNAILIVLAMVVWLVSRLEHRATINDTRR
jgi:hypothetical protein